MLEMLHKTKRQLRREQREAAEQPTRAEPSAPVRKVPAAPATQTAAPKPEQPPPLPATKPPRQLKPAMRKAPYHIVKGCAVEVRKAGETHWRAHATREHLYFETGRLVDGDLVFQNGEYEVRVDREIVCGTANGGRGERYCTGAG